MTFNEAKRILRELGYSVRKATERLPGVTEYNVHRIWLDPDTQRVEINRWLLTADSIKAGIHRAKHLHSNQQEQG
jgi:hypothetical protein